MHTRHGTPQDNRYTGPQHHRSSHTTCISSKTFPQSTDSQRGNRREGILTFVHRYSGIVLTPSTRRSRDGSVKLTSGMKMEHKMCTHAWPSVGLHARKYVSGGGYRVLLLGSRRMRGQRRQSGICIYVRFDGVGLREKKTLDAPERLLDSSRSRTAHTSTTRMLIRRQ